MTIAKYILALCCLSMFVGACKSGKEGATSKQEVNMESGQPGPPAIIYKTKQDYSGKVAVMLSEDRQQIIAYPDPKDIARRGPGVKPTLLEGGYLLDNQGINERVAFTRYTFAEYAALEEVPPMEQLQASIIDNNPLLEMCICGNRKQYAELEKSMNEHIADKLTKCEQLPLKEK